MNSRVQTILYQILPRLPTGSGPVCHLDYRQVQVQYSRSSIPGPVFHPGYRKVQVQYFIQTTIRSRSRIVPRLPSGHRTRINRGLELTRIRSTLPLCPRTRFSQDQKYRIRKWKVFSISLKKGAKCGVYFSTSRYVLSVPRRSPRHFRSMIFYPVASTDVHLISSPQPSNRIIESLTLDANPDT